VLNFKVGDLKDENNKNYSIIILDSYDV